MDEPTQPNMPIHDPADAQIDARLAAYAESLAPEPATLGRIRAGVVRAADARAAGRNARRGGLVILRRRPFLGLAAAAILTLVVVGGAFAASGPGAPLYGARLWLETVALPADAGARADAEMARLDTRVAEAERAAREGNGTAVTAALGAYQDELDAAMAATAGDPTRDERLQAVLERHRAVLQALVGALAGNGNASQAVQGALDRNAETIDRILGETPAGAPAGGAGPGQGGGNPNATPPGQGGGNPNATPPGQGGGNPHATPPGQGGGNPHATPPGRGNQAAPTPTPDPTATDRPGRTPAPKPTEDPTP